MSESSNPPPPQPDPNAKGKRYSMPRKLSDRRVTIRPYESFKERKESTRNDIKFGYASLSAEGRDIEEGRTSPTPSIFSIYGDDPGPSSICEQPVGAQADVFISSLNDKLKTQVKKFMEKNPRSDEQYFMWFKNTATSKMTVISIKTLENHLKDENRVRRVKWRHLSSERVSIYRYSIPAITYEQSKRCTDCLLRHKKITLITMWLLFVVFLCIIVVLGSINPEERKTHSLANITTQLQTENRTSI